MSKELAMAAAKVSPAVAWLGGEKVGFWNWLGQMIGGMNWPAVTGALTALYTILMMIHLIAHWDSKRPRSDDDGNTP